jgi:hypothetical protein
MGKRTAPSRSFLARETHRKWLTLHAVLLLGGLAAVTAANRLLTPDRLWFRWVALVWGLAFAAHLVVFSRETLATMGARRHPRP